MTHADQSERNNLDNIYDIYGLGDLLTAVYRDSDYRFGCLHFAEPMGDGNYPEHLVDPPEFMRGGWTMNYEIPMVLHPRKGALLLTTPWLPDEAPAEFHTVSLEDEHTKLVALEWKIRERLESLGYWKDRPIVMGVGLVTCKRVADEIRPECIPEVALIDREKLPTFATHVDALFEHYTRGAAKPIDEWGARLVADITDSDLLGSFVDEESHIESYEGWGCELDGLVETAAPSKASAIDQASISATRHRG